MTTMWIVAIAALLFMASANLAAGAQAAGGTFVCNFETADVAAKFKVSGARAEWTKNTEDGAVIEGVAFAKEVVESGALHLVLLPGKTYTTVEYSAADGMPSDWSGYGLFSMNFENGSEFMINLHLTLADESGAEFYADNLWIFRAKNRIDVPVDEIRTADGTALDMKRMRSMRLEIRSAEKFERDLWLFQFYLHPAGKAVVAPSKKRMLIDFGPLGAPVMAGAKLVTEKAAYARWRGCGWTSDTKGFQATYFKRPDALVSDWVWADLGAGAATLRVDLPAGKYRGRFYGGDYNTKAVATRAFTLSANGKAVAQNAADPAKYYTKKGHFIGIDEWYETGEDPYAKFVAKFYQTYDFEFEAGGGYAEFTWGKTLAAFGLLIAPAEGAEFEDACAAVEAARRESLFANLRFPEAPKKAPKATASEEKRGFILWSRGWKGDVGLYDTPAKKERSPRKLNIVAAGGQRQHVTLTATPLKPLGKVKIEVSELAGRKGAVLPAKAVGVRAVKYMWLGWPAYVGTGCLFPTDEVPSKDGVNVTFWVTVTPPPKTASGVYRGKIRISAANGGSAEVGLSVEVRPFALADDHPVAFALWRCSDYNMNYCMRYFLPERLDYFRKILDAEVADMKAHGLNSMYFCPPILKGVQGERVVLDFSILDEECRAAKKGGFCTPERPGMVFLLPDVARYLMKETRYRDFMEPEDLSPALPESEQLEEFSELFVKRYLDAARQIHAYFQKQGLSVLLYPSDEPRERNINRWNRNLEDTIRYSDLLHKNIPGARIYVDPMRDGNSGVDYLPLCDHVDVIGTHPWDQSGRIVEKCCRDGKPILWYFNMIMWDRYDFGLQQAASGATGCWQWHYQWDLVPFQPFHSGFKWGITVPGPNGPLDKPGYEMIAQGIDDYRYFATLERRVNAAEAAGKAKKQVAAARKAIAKFLKDAPPYAYASDYQGRSRAGRAKRDKVSGKTLDLWREEFAKHTEAIDKAK